MKRSLLIVVAMGAAALASGTKALAQLPAGDLRLWLKGDTLQVAEDGQVTEWVDSSSYGTVFKPRTLMWDGLTPVEENPHLQTVTVNSATFKSVTFERNGALPAGDPLVDRSGNTDRLFQTTNLTPGSDPLAIADGTSLTSFTVFKPYVTSSGALGFQAVWALRGNSASLMELGINPQGRFVHVSYDANTAYISSPVQPVNKWNIVEYSMLEQGANDALSFQSNSTEDPSAALVNMPVVTNGGLIQDRNDGMNEDPVGSVEPFGIGGHAQNCCGEGETFAGNIAEIIIYAGELSAGDKAQVYAYLTNKYLAVPEPTTALLALVGLMGVSATRRRRA
jgi:hypothetical protein